MCVCVLNAYGLSYSMLSCALLKVDESKLGENVYF